MRDRCVSCDAYRPEAPLTPRQADKLLRDILRELSAEEEESRVDNLVLWLGNLRDHLLDGGACPGLHQTGQDTYHQDFH